MRWNAIVHREPDSAWQVNPDLDVVTSDAWVAIDESNCALIEVPEIKRRYYTVQVVNGWGEVTANINERTSPGHPYGTFALCLVGTSVVLPKGTQRIDVVNKASRLFAHIERGANPAIAVELQNRTTIAVTGAVQVEPPPAAPAFTLEVLPGVEVFDQADAVLASEADVNPNMEPLQAKVRAASAAIADPQTRARVADVVRVQAIPHFMAEVAAMEMSGWGWTRLRRAGTYGQNFLRRSTVNYARLWANSMAEVISFASDELQGSVTHLQTFWPSSLPHAKAAYWSVTVLDAKALRVVYNAFDRYQLNSHSPLRYNKDGSLTLAFSPTPSMHAPKANWLRTPVRKKYRLIYRYYRPTEDVVAGGMYPAPLLPPPYDSRIARTD